jgi:hypothetical protein
MSRIHVAAAVLFVAAVAGSLGWATAAFGQSGGGGINAFAFAQNAGPVDTTSATAAPVPQMAVTYKGQGAAIVRFCADGNMFGTGSGATQVSAKLDGVQLGNEIQFFTSDDSSVTPRCFEWVTGELTPGTHTVTIGWRLTQAAGSSLTGRFHNSVVTVLFR